MPLLVDRNDVSNEFENPEKYINECSVEEAEETNLFAMVEQVAWSPAAFCSSKVTFPGSSFSRASLKAAFPALIC